MANRLVINTTGTAWFLGFSLAFISLLILLLIKNYTKLGFYDKIFCNI